MHSLQFVLYCVNRPRQHEHQALRSHPHKTLLIHSNYCWCIAVERPYAPKLNQQIQKAMDAKKLQWDYRFDGNMASFYPVGEDQNGLGEQDATKWKVILSSIIPESIEGC